MKQQMAMVGLCVLGALMAGCSGVNRAGTAEAVKAAQTGKPVEIGPAKLPGPPKHQTVAEKFMAFNKSGWSVTNGGSRPKPIPGSGGVFYTRNPQQEARTTPWQNSVWSTNFKLDKKEQIPGVNIVDGGANGAVNVVGTNGKLKTAAPATSLLGPNAGNWNVTGPHGTGVSVTPAANGNPLNTGVQVMGPDGKIHSTAKDLGQSSLLPTALHGN